MDLSILDDLQAKIVRRVPDPMPYKPVMKIDMEAAQRIEQGPDYVEFRASLELGYKVIAPSEDENRVRAEAVESLRREIYGPIEIELYRLKHDLWEQGGFEDTPAMRRIDQMMRELRGMPR